MSLNRKHTTLSYLKIEHLWIFFKWLIFFAVIYLVYLILQKREVDFAFVIIHLKRVLSFKNLFLLFLVFIMSFFNWGFEAKKWQILANRAENVTFKDAFKGVLIGLSFGFISQSDLGDLAGKMVLIKNENRIKSTGAVLLGGGIQTYVSLIFGTIGLNYFIFNVFKEIKNIEYIIFGLCLLSLLIGVFLLNYRKKIETLLTYFSFLSFAKPYLIILSSYNNAELFQIFTLSVSRYLIFASQFLIILLIFQIELPILVLSMIIFLVFFVKTIIPSISFISDLGVRSMTSLYLFEFYNINPSAVIAATLTLWCINILFPVLMGAAILLGLKKVPVKQE